MRYLIDEDLSTDIARIGRRIGLDVVSIHEIGREGWTDEQQLTRAAEERRCIVTGNCRDFEDLTWEFYAAGRPHAGVRCVQGALRYAEPATVARAPLAFDLDHGDFAADYFSGFLYLVEEE
jgi:Domain of unknown function (DUF5615)